MERSTRGPGTDDRTISHMKKAKDSTAHAHPSVTRSPKSDPQSLRNFFRNAARNLSGVFGVFAFRKTSSPEAVASELPSRPSLPVLSDVSKGSNVKSASRMRSSFSFSSTSTAFSTQVRSIEFTLQEIMKVTGNFSAANVIGEGAFGTVYKGKLMDGSVVAIKRAYKMKGFVEEYIGSGTLLDHLNGEQGNGLEIAERLDIAIDISHGVTSLLSYTDPQIIHRDIKASNKLITETQRAKVADFGFARVASEDPGATHISTQAKGSTGYLDPEYLKTYQLSEKSDVYSFWVLLIEMMTGRHPIEPKQQPNERVTIKWAMLKLKQGDPVLVMDWRVRRKAASIMVLEEVLKLARQCIAPTKQSRPSMKKCAEVLSVIQKNYRERTTPAAPSASQHSANYPTRDVKTQRHVLWHRGG